MSASRVSDARYGVQVAAREELSTAAVVEVEMEVESMLRVPEIDAPVLVVTAAAAEVVAALRQA